LQVYGFIQSSRSRFRLGRSPENQPAPVIPAKSFALSLPGIRFPKLGKRTGGRLDSRFRGNDCVC
jgi:hypothetical protein